MMQRLWDDLRFINQLGHFFSFENYKSHFSGWWFGTFSIFPSIGNVIIPTNELIFFRGVAKNHQPVFLDEVD